MRSRRRGGSPALVQRQPANRRARRLLAAAQWRMNDPAAVVATLRPLADRPDADAYALSLIGRALARTGDADAAALYLARAAAPQPAALAALDPLGEGEFAARPPRRRGGSGRRPGPGPLISALLGRGQSDEALARARRLQDANPGAPEVHILVGDALGARGDFAARRRPISPRRQSRLHRSGGDAPDRGAAARRARGTRPTTCSACSSSKIRASVPGLILLAARAMQAEDWPGAIAHLREPAPAARRQ